MGISGAAPVGATTTEPDRRALPDDASVASSPSQPQAPNVSTRSERDDATSPRTLSRGTHYRPQLDGLRAVAVYLVVAFHAGVGSFSGGYIGVDVFFVLSGYLVTQLLLRDLGSIRRIRFRVFYSRRVRRLLPAAFVTLLVTAVVYAAVVSPSEAKDAIGGFRSSFLYVANWYFIRQSADYFAANVNTNPVLHFWSLAVEEQFYLVWPLLLSGIILIARRAGRVRWNIVRAIVLVGGLVSFIAAVATSHGNLSRAYYGTGTRAYELLAGALLALTPQVMRFLKARRGLVQALAPVNLAILVLLGTSAVDFGPIVRGACTVVATCGLIAALEVSIRGVAKGLLSTPTAVYLGRVSYGTYLWHWPFIIIVTTRFHPSGIQLFALTCLAATGLASLSYQVLERPVRESRRLDRVPILVIAGGLATSVIAGVFIAPAILHHDSGASSAASFATSEAGGWQIPVPAGLDIDGAKNASYGSRSCFGKPVDECIAVRGSGQRVLLVGDSHALVLVPAFSDIARRHNLTLALAVLPNCAWERGLVPAPFDFPANLPASCRARQDDWYDRVLPQFDPDIVVFAQRGIDDALNPESVFAPDGTRMTPGTAEYDQVLRTTSAATIDALRQAGRKVVIIESVPLARGDFDPLACLSKARFLESCRYTAAARVSPVTQYYRDTEDGEHVWSLDIDKLVCPYFPICDPVIDGTIVKKDPQHITAAYSHKIADPLDAALRRNRILG